MSTRPTPASGLTPAGFSVMRYGLVTAFVWIGALKFTDYEVENAEPRFSSAIRAASNNCLAEKATLASRSDTDPRPRTLRMSRSAASGSMASEALPSRDRTAPTYSVTAAVPVPLANRRSTGRSAVPGAAELVWLEAAADEVG